MSIETRDLHKKRKGLLPEEHALLNSGEFILHWPAEKQQAEYNRLREKYANDPAALKEIDTFDTSSPYGIKLKEYDEAFRSNDIAKQEELKAWFDIHYPKI